MSDDLVARPAPAEAGRKLAAAQTRLRQAAPTIAATRAEILAELERHADASPRYANWPERVPGVPIGFMPGLAGPLCYDLDTHRLVIGRSGGGKATAAISYMLLHDDGHAAILVDPKNGTVARATAGYRQTLGPVHIVDPYNMTGYFDASPSARFNPFDALDRTSEMLVEDAYNLASALCYMPQGGGNDSQYWDRQARAYTTALILHLVTCPGETPDLLRFRELLTMPLADFLQQAVKPMLQNPACGGTVMRDGEMLQRHALANARGFEDVFATIRSYVPWIEFQQLRAVNSRSTFDFAEVRAQGGTVYIVMDDDRLEDCASWLRLMLQCARLGLKRSSSRRPVHFIIDEAAALGKLDLITTGLRAWRSANIRLHLFYQDVAQIKDAFREGWNSVANAGVLQFMGCNPGDLETAEYVSKIFGERDMIVPTLSKGSTHTDGTSKTSSTGTSRTRSTGKTTTETDTFSRSVGSNWSTTIGKSRTVGSNSSVSIGSNSSSGSSMSNGPGGLQATSNSGSGTSFSESLGTSQSETESLSHAEGGNESKTVSKARAAGTSKTKAAGETSSKSEGTSQSDGTSENRSFTLQLRRTLRPEQVRMLPPDQMIVIADSCEPALVHKEHYYRNPRLVRRAAIQFDSALAPYDG